MKNFLIYLAIGLFASLLVTANGQTVIANYTKQTEHLAIAREGNVIWLAASKAGVLKCDLTGNILETYTTANGLAGNIIYDILIDQQGRHWFATDGGISVLEISNNWTQYPYNVKSITQATNGDIWAVGKNIHTLVASTGIWNIVIFNWYINYDRTVRIGPDNTVYVGGAAGLAVRNPNTLDWFYYNTYVYDWDLGYVYDPVQDIEFDTQGNVWVIKNGGLFTFSDGVFSTIIGTFIDNAPSTPSIALDKLPNGNLLIGALNGLWIYNETPTLKEFKSRPGFRSVYDFVVDSNNKFWFSTDLGFSKFEDAAFDHYTPGNQTLATEDVFKILIDESNKKWFLGKGGRSISGDKLWITHPYNYFDPIWALDASFEPTGTKWFQCRSGNGVYLTRLRNDSITLFPSLQTGFDSFTRLHWDPRKNRTIIKNQMDHRFWYFDADILKSFDILPSNGSCLGPNWGCFNVNDKHVRHFSISAEGYYYWTSQQGYFYSLWGHSIGIANDTLVYSCGEDNSPLYYCPSTPDFCACNNNNFVAFDSMGNTWLASDLGIRVKGPDFQNLGNYLYYFTTSNSSLPNDTVQCIVFDPIGNAWIGTRNGLAILNLNLNWAILNTSNSNLVGNNIHSIVFDPDGSVWIGTETGVSHMTLTTLAADVPIGASAFQVFPNPLASGDCLTVKMGLSRTGKVNFELRDLSGKTVQNFVFPENKSENNTFLLKVAGLPAGLYFLTAHFEEKVLGTEKVILK